MKLSYDSEETRKAVIRLSQDEPVLYDMLMQVLLRFKSFDFDALTQHICEELAKSDRTKLIKYINDEYAYEYRLPPKRKQGVLRMLFQIEDDFYTVRILKVWVKSQEPRQNNSKPGRKSETRK